MYEIIKADEEAIRAIKRKGNSLIDDIFKALTCPAGCGVAPWVRGSLLVAPLSHLPPFSIQFYSLSLSFYLVHARVRARIQKHTESCCMCLFFNVPIIHQGK